MSVVVSATVKVRAGDSVTLSHSDGGRITGVRVSDALNFPILNNASVDTLRALGWEVTIEHREPPFRDGLYVKGVEDPDVYVFADGVLRHLASGVDVTEDATYGDAYDDLVPLVHPLYAVTLAVRAVRAEFSEEDHNPQHDARLRAVVTRTENHIRGAR